jgi:hypothetical protein
MTEEERLVELLLVWEERYESGTDVPAAELCHELCPDRPDLAPVLAALIESLKRMAWMNDPTSDDEGQTRSGPPPSGPLAGRYRLDERIGEGGFGQVWKGFDLELQRPVAVKLPRPDRHPGGPDEVFLIEARKSATLACPGIIPVYDVGRHGGRYFIVSELIDGIDLARRRKAGALGARDAVRIAAEIAEALDHVHRRGLLHLDVKPGNVLLDPAGRALLTDFGIAAARSEGPVRLSGVGTPGYMAPEQRPDGSGEVDHRTDLYALGVLLCELLTGVRPTNSSLPGAVPRSVGPILQRCLSDAPADRYPNAADLAAELRAAGARLLTEDEWRATSDPHRVRTHIIEYPVDRRKVRLFACACVRAGWPGQLTERALRMLAVAEGYADGRFTSDEFWASSWAAWERVEYEPSPEAGAAWALDASLWGAARETARRVEPGVQCAIWRDLFGPLLFRSVNPSRWRSTAAVELAQEMDRTGHYRRLPELADALERAGCTAPDVLSHCRCGGPHYRGCWVVDLVGREP